MWTPNEVTHMGVWTDLGYSDRGLRIPEVTHRGVDTPGITNTGDCELLGSPRVGCAYFWSQVD